MSNAAKFSSGDAAPQRAWRSHWRSTNTVRAANGSTAIADPYEHLLETSEAMAICRVTDKAAFLANARKTGLPFIRYNSRRFLWPEKALRSWLAARTVGKVPV